MNKLMTISAIHTGHQTIRFKTPIVFTFHETSIENIYYTEWHGMRLVLEGEEKELQQKILEYLVYIYNEYIVKGRKLRDKIMQKRIEKLFDKYD